jgi:hypothetical protein
MNVPQRAVLEKGSVGPFAPVAIGFAITKKGSNVVPEVVKPS